MWWRLLSDAARNPVHVLNHAGVLMHVDAVQLAVVDVVRRILKMGISINRLMSHVLRSYVTVKVDVVRLKHVVNNSNKKAPNEAPFYLNAFCFSLEEVVAVFWRQHG